MALEVDGQSLYAVAIQRIRHNGRIDSKIFHIHAESPGHARAHFCQVFPNRRTHYIVAAAPVIGLFVNDKKGNDVSVT